MWYGIIPSVKIYKHGVGAKFLCYLWHLSDSRNLYQWSLCTKIHHWPLRFQKLLLIHRKASTYTWAA